MGDKYLLSRRGTYDPSSKEYLALTDSEGNLVASSKSYETQPLLFDIDSLPEGSRSELEKSLEKEVGPFKFGKILRNEGKVNIESARDVLVYTGKQRQVKGDKEVYENFLTGTALMHFLKGYFPEGDSVTESMENSSRKIQGIVERAYDERERE